MFTRQDITTTVQRSTFKLVPRVRRVVQLRDYKAIEIAQQLNKGTKPGSCNKALTLINWKHDPLQINEFPSQKTKIKILCLLYSSSHFYFHAISLGCSQGGHSIKRRAGTSVSGSWRLGKAWTSARIHTRRINSTSQGQRKMVWESICNANEVERKKGFQCYLPLFIWRPQSRTNESERNVVEVLNRKVNWSVVNHIYRWGFQTSYLNTHFLLF